MQKTFKVARVLDDFKIVMNAGSNQNISLGQKYLLYAISDQEIIDPDTHKSLGFLEIVKGTGVVTHVQDDLSTLESAVYSSHSKKIKRSNPMTAPFGSIIEEIEIDKTQEPFDEPHTGDLLKRVN